MIRWLSLWPKRFFVFAYFAQKTHRHKRAGRLQDARYRDCWEFARPSSGAIWTLGVPRGASYVYRDVWPKEMAAIEARWREESA
jgi:hypothetical protein